LTTGEAGIFPINAIEIALLQPQTPVASMLKPSLQHQHSGSAVSASAEENRTLVDSETRSQSTLSANGRASLSPPSDGSFMFSLATPQKALSSKSLSHSISSTHNSDTIIFSSHCGNARRRTCSILGKVGCLDSTDP
jgi:hypothetical protein